jgi:hypothetical protein
VWHLADKDMLQHIDPGALSYRRNASISTESALVAEKHIAINLARRILAQHALPYYLARGGSG